MIRVLHIITRLDRGGSAENTLLTAAGCDPERFVSAVASGPSQEPDARLLARAGEAGVLLVEVEHLVRPIRPLADLRALAALWGLLRGGHFHIVHTHTSKAGLLGRLAARLAGAGAVVHTPHGHVFHGYYGPLKTQLFARLERSASRWCDRIVALTPAEVEDYAALGVAPREQCVVIHSGVDFSAAQQVPERTEVRRQLGLPAGALVVGTVGRLTAIKGQDLLLEAFARLRAGGTDARLLLVGDGEERAALEARARALGMGAQVLFCGWREDVFALLGAMDLFAFPSRNEGMGKALVQAMHMGLACVASRTGGIPHILTHGAEGLLFENGEVEGLAAALGELAGDPQKRRVLGQAARLKAARYSAERMVEELEELYVALLEEKGSEI